MWLQRGLWSGADLDLTAKGGIAAHKVRGEIFGGIASLCTTQHSYVYDNWQSY